MHVINYNFIYFINYITYPISPPFEMKKKDEIFESKISTVIYLKMHKLEKLRKKTF